MKLILENWRRYLKEHDEPEEGEFEHDEPEEGEFEEDEPEKKYTEATSFRLHDLTEEEKENLFRTFEESYSKATGKSWPREFFLYKASRWIFFGNVGEKTGIVAVRPQEVGGRYKLVAIAGDIRSILKGVSSLRSEIGSSPIWGLVSSNMVSMVERLGLVAAHNKPGGPTLIKTIMKLIPPSVFGPYKVELQNDGGISVDIENIGNVSKYFVANKAYYEQLIEEHGSKVPMLAPALRFLLKMIK
jgi:hypothetical protein